MSEEKENIKYDRREYYRHLREGESCQVDADKIEIKSFGEFDTRIYKNGEEISRKGDYMTARSYYAKMCAKMNPREKFWFE